VTVTRGPRTDRAVFFSSRDGGRDGAFSGTWKRQGSEDLKGRFVIQCKFTGKSDSVTAPLT
jgi:hypothetical protein